jgi:hypothetical protein
MRSQLDRIGGVFSEVNNKCVGRTLKLKIAGAGVSVVEGKFRLGILDFRLL